MSTTAMHRREERRAEGKVNAPKFVADSPSGNGWDSL